MVSFTLSLFLIKDKTLKVHLLEDWQLVRSSAISNLVCVYNPVPTHLTPSRLLGHEGVCVVRGGEPVGYVWHGFSGHEGVCVVRCGELVGYVWRVYGGCL